MNSQNKSWLFSLLVFPDLLMKQVQTISIYFYFHSISEESISLPVSFYTSECLTLSISSLFEELLQ